MRLAEIGTLPGGGVDRQALTEIEAWRLVTGWAVEAGMEPSTDPAGNLFLILPGVTAACRQSWSAATWTPSPPAAASTARSA
jgi:hypothetical protein